MGGRATAIELYTGVSTGPYPPKLMYILGINLYHADVSAVLLRDGELLVAVEEERFRRIKHWSGFPTQSIRKCLEVAGITGDQVSHVAISKKPRAHLLRKAAYTLRHRPPWATVSDRARNARKFLGLTQPLSEALGVSAANTPQVHYVEHHPAHLASSFFVSPFDDASLCAIDGFGDFVSTSMAIGEGNQMKVLDHVFFPHSLGMLYTAVTEYLGFTGFGDEFKVMGLAPYGTPEVSHLIRKMVRLESRGRFKLDLRYYRHHNEHISRQWEEGYPTTSIVHSDEVEKLLGPKRKADEPIGSFHENVAASLQQVFEECAFHVLNGLWERTKNPRLCLAGGCAMNSVANGKVRDNTPFTHLFVQPASADNGTALGAAYYVANQTLHAKRSFVMKHGYWGTEYPNADISHIIKNRNDPEWSYEIRHFEGDDVCTETAKLISEGNVVGWYQGRMEWGARALGNRSIVADPRRADMRELINTKIKFRERFRPFAPSILEERLDEYFEGAVPDPFMLQVYPVRAEKHAVIPAVTHVDGSGRLQTVSPTTNARYYMLISEFDRLTGVPIVLNTSFNENEPIVDTPEQALDCFLRTRMDCIVLNNTMVRRKPRA